MPHRSQSLRRFRFHRPQRIAAGLLALFLAQGLWLAGSRSQAAFGAAYARCGLQMWQNPAPRAMDATSCGRIRDGILAYRLAGLPLALVDLAGRVRDFAFRRDTPGLSTPSQQKTARPSGFFRSFCGTNREGWMEALCGGALRRTIFRLLPRLPFLAAGWVLGGCLWWVTRRLYGNLGGYTALALYCFSPEVLRSGAAPDADILAALALYRGVYTCIGVAHAMQGPRQRWRPRILLLTAAFSVAAAAHIVALPVAALLGLAAMLWIAEGRRGEIVAVVLLAMAGAVAAVFACYGFSLHATGWAFGSASSLVRFSLEPARRFFGSAANAGITAAACAASALYLSVGRSRYFGNTTPLLCAAVCLGTIPAGDPAGAWLWAQPFLFTFAGGVLADAYESRHGRWALAAAAAMVALQAAVCVAHLPGLP